MRRVFLFLALILTGCASIKSPDSKLLLAAYMMGRMEAIREMEQADPHQSHRPSRALGLPKKPTMIIGSGQ
jgi:uncharacterized protein YceK